MGKLLIADPALAEALTELLREEFHIVCCDTGDQVLRELMQFQPDILLMDLMLPGGDGISVMHAAMSAGICPAVVMTTVYISPYILQTLEELHVSYLMMKPCSVPALAARILDVAAARTDCDPEESLKRRIRGLFLILGLRRNLTGYRYLLEASVLYYRDPELSLTKQIYPAAAAIFGVSWQQVERSIRTCIQDAYVKRTDLLWRMYFPAGRDGRVRRVTTAHFIAKIADCLHQEDSR